jgi:hypothetical protein
MPKKALAVTLEEWESLLAGIDAQADLNDPYVRELRDELAAMIQATRALANEKAHLQARCQAITQQVRITRRETEDLVVKIRSTLRGRYGHTNEGLVRFRIRPKRRHSREEQEKAGIAVFAMPDLRPGAAAEPDESGDSPEET